MNRQGLMERPTYPYCPVVFVIVVEVVEQPNAALCRSRSRTEATDYVPLADGYSPVEYPVYSAFRAPNLP